MTGSIRTTSSWTPLIRLRPSWAHSQPAEAVSSHNTPPAFVAWFQPLKDKESAMANSRRNSTQLQPPSELDPCPREWAEPAKGNDGPIGESRATLETPNVGHAGPRSECWISTGLTESTRRGSPLAASGRPALRFWRQPRRRTPLHCARPVERAAARFVPPDSEYLTD